MFSYNISFLENILFHCAEKSLNLKFSKETQPFKLRPDIALKYFNDNFNCLKKIVIHYRIIIFNVTLFTYANNCYFFVTVITYCILNNIGFFADDTSLFIIINYYDVVQQTSSITNDLDTIEKNGQTHALRFECK